jgi:hypothetical protein
MQKYIQVDIDPAPAAPQTDVVVHSFASETKSMHEREFTAPLLYRPASISIAQANKKFLERKGSTIASEFHADSHKLETKLHQQLQEKNNIVQGAYLHRHTH